MQFARVVLGKPISIEFTNDLQFKFAACYGDDRILVSKVRHGNAWFDGPVEEHMQDWTELIIHELAHDKVSDHLSEAFHDECCRLGARYAAHLQRLLAEQQVHQR